MSSKRVPSVDEDLTPLLPSPSRSIGPLRSIRSTRTKRPPPVDLSSSSEKEDEGNDDGTRSPSSGTDEEDTEDMKLVEKVFACRRAPSIADDDTASPAVGNEKSAAVDMQYFVKFYDQSYRKVAWWSRSELIAVNAANEARLASFHRRNTDNDPTAEYPLSPQVSGNIRLFTQPDRIIAVREGNDGMRDFLVKWTLLGYSESTWEPESSLDEDLIQRFERVNHAFEFPTRASPPSHVRMMGAARKSRKDESPLQEESYRSATVDSKEKQSRMWGVFLKRKLAADGSYMPSAEQQRKLMAHQQDGLKWLFYNTEVNRHGSLLADEMGLGKTCQSITFLEHLLDIMSAGNGMGCHALVVVQKSVMENWRREFAQWAPHLDVLALCGGKEDRQLAAECEQFWQDTRTGKTVKPPGGCSAPKFIKPDVVLVTYEGLRSKEFLSIQPRNRNFRWTVVVVDECQKIKGGRSSMLLTNLQGLKRDFVLLLTGTPVQNSTEELLPMLTLLHPTRFYYDEPRGGSHDKHKWSESRFVAAFSQLQDREDCLKRTEELHALMAPYILRREKSAVLRTLPPKKVQLVHIPLTLIQKRVYSALYHRSIKSKGLKFTNMHMQLRKCCIHPYLIEGMEQLILQGKISDATDEAACMNDEEDEETREKRLLIDASGKFQLLQKMLSAFYEQKRKVLVFSFFKTALDLVEEMIAHYDLPWKTERVDGETTGEDRQLAVDRFNSDPERFLFLCTTRAGGLGLNLTSASVVVHLDSDFNPQHDLQAQARCHRIGQLQDVAVYHFIAEHTYEDYMLFNIAGKKLGLEAVLLGRLDRTTSKLKMDRQQEERMLRRGVFAAVRDDEAAQNDARAFAAASIEDILNTKATTVELHADKVETPGTAQDEATSGNADDNESRTTAVSSAPGSGTTQGGANTMFTTARFEVDEARKNDSQERELLRDLNEDEPDFWEKVAERLGPWTLQEEHPQELLRSDRRRGRSTISYSLQPGVDSDSDTGEEDHDAAFQPASEPSGEDTEDDGEAEQLDKDDMLHVAVNSKPPATKQRARKRARAADAHGAAGTPAGATASQPAPAPSLGAPGIPSDAYVAVQQRQQHHQMQQQQQQQQQQRFVAQMQAEGAGNVILVLELLYRALRALRQWRKTRTALTGGLRAEDIRECDKWAPWTELCRGKVSNDDDVILRSSWLETLQEWKRAGEEFSQARMTVVDRVAEDVLSRPNSQIDSRWTAHLQTLPVAVRNDEAKLVHCMNMFFVAEARRVALTLHLEVVVGALQSLADVQAAEVLNGRHFSREFTVKRQTWIAAEDFTIKLVFVHLLSQQWNNRTLGPATAIREMRWPPPTREIDWALVTDVVKRLNRYTGGPDRRRAAVQERFYNKLDSRWNHDDMMPHERTILAYSIANNIPPSAACEELPTRSLERVKKALRCPLVIKEAEERKIASSEINAEGDMVVVDVLKRFRQACAEVRAAAAAAGGEHSQHQLQPSAEQIKAVKGHPAETPEHPAVAAAMAAVASAAPMKAEGPAKTELLAQGTPPSDTSASLAAAAVVKCSSAEQPPACPSTSLVNRALPPAAAAERRIAINPSPVSSAPPQQQQQVPNPPPPPVHMHMRFTNEALNLLASIGVPAVQIPAIRARLAAQSLLGLRDLIKDLLEVRLKQLKGEDDSPSAPITLPTALYLGQGISPQTKKTTKASAPSQAVQHSASVQLATQTAMTLLAQKQQGQQQQQQQHQAGDQPQQSHQQQPTTQQRGQQQQWGSPALASLLLQQQQIQQQLQQQQQQQKLHQQKLQQLQQLQQQRQMQHLIQQQQQRQRLDAGGAISGAIAAGQQPTEDLLSAQLKQQPEKVQMAAQPQQKVVVVTAKAQPVPGAVSMSTGIPTSPPPASSTPQQPSQQQQRTQQAASVAASRVSEIQRRMTQDPAFAAKVLEHVNRLRNGSAAATSTTLPPPTA